MLAHTIRIVIKPFVFILIELLVAILQCFIAVDIGLVAFPILGRLVELYGRCWYIYFAADRFVCAVVAIVKCTYSECWWGRTLAIYTF